ncbi:transposase [Intrasporangium oryzae NRRL B-24470]|uniref:Transposase n=1 Tax=Intrasporangium oryzae NRRL B-24470 TaxID=1386089 RepID=W9G702_9MICO|nr:IS5 family transposase [Intrasporangium oryzae]EWT01052.1 transposase [Intrasporangium oryzae NRRL B-24470]
MSTISAASRHDLSDAQWALLEPLLPTASTRGRPRRYPLRALVDGVRHRTRVGCPWRDVPERYGPWWRVYALFACWQLLGVWERIEAALIAAADAAGKLSWQVSVDSTTSRAHVHAAGARRDSVDLVAGEPDHHALGRSRGGRSTKTHLACDQHRGVLSFLLTPGQAPSAMRTSARRLIRIHPPRLRVAMAGSSRSMTAPAPPAGGRGREGCGDRHQGGAGAALFRVAAYNLAGAAGSCRGAGYPAAGNTAV